jgi:hypothetical protein
VLCDHVINSSINLGNGILNLVEMRTNNSHAKLLFICNGIAFNGFNYEIGFRFKRLTAKYNIRHQSFLWILNNL